jgi:hypothetical protein
MGRVPPLFTDIVHYSSVNYEDPAGNCDPTNNDPSNCTDLTVNFHAAPFDHNYETPTFQQARADDV